MGKQTQTSRMDNLDLLKALGIMAVVSLHVNLWNCDFVGGNWRNIIQYAFRLIAEGVPIFLAINGFLLLRKDTFDMKKHIRKIVKLLGLFAVWAVILTVAGCTLATPGESITPYVIIRYFLKTKVGAPYTGVLWYIQGLVGVYTVFPVIWYVYKNKFEIFRYFFVVMCIFVPGAKCIELAINLAGAYVNVDKAMELVKFIGRFSGIGNAWYMFYFCLGGMIWHYKDILIEKKRLVAGLGIASWPMAFVYGYVISVATGKVFKPSFNYASPFMALFVVGVIILTMGYKNKGNVCQNLIADIGRNTLGMYLSHFLFIYIYEHFVYAVGFGQKMIEWLVVCACAYLFSIIVKRIPGIREIVKM